jgi:hypothetical protein
MSELLRQLRLAQELGTVSREVGVKLLAAATEALAATEQRVDKLTIALCDLLKISDSANSRDIDAVKHALIQARATLSEASTAPSVIIRKDDMLSVDAPNDRLPNGRSEDDVIDAVLLECHRIVRNQL